MLSFFLVYVGWHEMILLLMTLRYFYGCFSYFDTQTWWLLFPSVLIDDYNMIAFWCGGTCIYAFMIRCFYDIIVFLYVLCTCLWIQWLHVITAWLWMFRCTFQLCLHMVPVLLWKMMYMFSLWVHDYDYHVTNNTRVLGCLEELEVVGEKTGKQT